MISNISFCILSPGRSEGIINRAIASISRQRIPSREILVCGELPAAQNIKVLRSNGWSETGELNRMRNLLCSNATGNFVVLMDENIELSDGWYEAIKDADCFDIAGSRIVTEDGARAIDWAYQVKLGGKSYAFPLQYDEWTTKAYVSGKLMLLRKRVWERIKFDEALKRGDCDDVEFCLRASSAGFRIGVLPEAGAKYIDVASKIKTDVTFEKSQSTVDAFKKAFTMGHDAFKSGDYERALTNLANARELVPDHTETLSLIGWTYYFMGVYERALTVFDEAIVADPASHSAFRGRGWTFLQRGIYRKAVNELTMALELVNPVQRDDWLETVRGLAWSHYHNGTFDEAIEYFESLVGTADVHETGLLQDVCRGLGWCCYRKGMFSEATAHFNNALSKLDPGNHELIQDAKRGLELATVGASQDDPVRGYRPLLLKPNVSLTLRQKPPFRSGATWCRSLATVLKGVVKRILRLN